MKPLVRKIGAELVDGGHGYGSSIHWKCLYVRSGDPELLVAHPGLLYSLLSTQSKSWWWDAGQSNCLYFYEDGIPCPSKASMLEWLNTERRSTSALSIDLCESGRFFLTLRAPDKSDWVLVDPERFNSSDELPYEVTRSGGNEPQVLALATVPWVQAWDAVVGFFISNGDRHESVNWKPYDEVEARHGEILIT